MYDFSCPDNKFQPISSVLLSGMMKLISETKDDSRLRSLAYVAVGKIVRRAPQLVKKDIGLAQKLFDAIGQVGYWKTWKLHCDAWFVN